MKENAKRKKQKEKKKLNSWIILPISYTTYLAAINNAKIKLTKQFTNFSKLFVVYRAYKF